MSKLHLACVLTVAATALAPATAAKDYRLESGQWSVASVLKTNTPYTLRNLVNGKPVVYGKRTWGINLEWETGKPQWVFRKDKVQGVRNPPNGGSLPVRDQTFASDEAVGIFNMEEKSYLVHDSRVIGVDLGWSRSPRYQWKVARSASGEVSLYNTSARDYLVHGVRGEGINLAWLSGVKLAMDGNGVGSIHKATVFMNAQVVTQGYLPFLGTYGGGGTKAVLTKVANAQPNVHLNFVKPGFSTTQCGQNGATLRLGASETMTPAQMTTLWGSATPALATPVQFLACVVGSNANIVLVNIEYRVTN
jgi:hypothetical protein